MWLRDSLVHCILARTSADYYCDLSSAKSAKVAEIASRLPEEGSPSYASMTATTLGVELHVYNTNGAILERYAAVGAVRVQVVLVDGIYYAR